MSKPTTPESTVESTTTDSPTPSKGNFIRHSHLSAHDPAALRSVRIESLLQHNKEAGHFSVVLLQLLCLVVDGVLD